MAANVQLLLIASFMTIIASSVVHASAVVKRESHQRPMKLTWVPVVEPKDLANAQSLVIGIQPLQEGDSSHGSDYQDEYGKTKTGSKLVMDLTPIDENNKWVKYGGHSDENRYNKQRPTKPNSYKDNVDTESFYDVKPSESFQDEGKAVDEGQSQPAEETDEHDEVSTRTFVKTPREYDTSGSLDESGPSFTEGDHRPIYTNEGDHFSRPSEKYVDTHSKFFQPEEFDGHRGAASIQYDDDDDDEDDHAAFYVSPTHAKENLDPDHGSLYSSPTHSNAKGDLDPDHGSIYSSPTETKHKDDKDNEDDYFGPLEEFEGAYAPDVGHRQASEHQEDSHKDDSVGGTSDDVHPVRHNDLEPSRNMFKDLGFGYNGDSSDSEDKFDFDKEEIPFDGQKYHIPKMKYPPVDESIYKVKSGSEHNDETETPAYRYVPEWSDVTEASDIDIPENEKDKSVTIDTYEDSNNKQPEGKESIQTTPQRTSSSGFFFQPVQVEDSLPTAKFIGNPSYIEPAQPREEESYKQSEPSQPSQQSYSKPQPSADPYAFPGETSKKITNANYKTDSRKNYNAETQPYNSKFQEKPSYKQERNFQHHRSESRPSMKTNEQNTKNYDEGHRTQPTNPKPQRHSDYEHEHSQSAIPKPFRNPNFFEQELAFQKYRFQPKPVAEESKNHDVPQPAVQQAQRKPQYDNSKYEEKRPKPQQKSQTGNSRSEDYLSKPQHIPVHILRDFLPLSTRQNEQKSRPRMAPSTINHAPKPLQSEPKPQRRPTEDQQYQAMKIPAPSRDYTDSQRYDKPHRVASIPRPTKHQGGLGIGIGFLSDIETPQRHSEETPQRHSEEKPQRHSENKKY